MKHFKSTIVFISIIFFGLSIFAQTSGYERMRKNRAQNIAKRNFSIEKTRLIEGKIMKVEKMSYGQYAAPGIHLVVSDGKESFTVLMGPETFFNQKGIIFKAGDPIKLNTFEGTFKEKTAFYASSLVQDKNVTLIRDKSGNPSWSRSAGYRSGPGKGRGRGRSSRGYRNR